MKLLILLTAFFGVPFFSYTQVSISWIDSATDQTGGAIISDTANSTFTAGSRNNATYITKRNQAGETIWQASGSSSLSEAVTDIFLDPQGNPVVAGFQYYNTINGIIATSLMVRKFTPAGDSVYRRIIPGLFTFLDGGDVEHPGNNQTKITAAMDTAGNVYFGTAGEAGAGKGVQLVKVNSNGTTGFIKSQNFNQDTTGNPFFLANNITLRNNRVGITGTTLRTLSNTCTWVIDTAGNTFWSDITPKVAGADLVFDEAFNTMVVATGSNIAGNETWGDVVLIKFNAAGKRISAKGYDFGNNEIPSRIIYAADKSFIIMARADGTSTLGFLDWFTIKIKHNGQVAWSRRYNASNYDEMPKKMATDAAGNVYVIGTGGPDTGEFFYGLYGVTIKYAPSGTELWKSLIHLFNLSPVDITLGADNSVFVLSSPNAGVVRLLQKANSLTCAIPAGLKASAVTTMSATVSWKKVPDNFIYQLQYRAAGSDTWTAVSLDSNHYRIENLVQGKRYEYRVQAVCATGPSGFSTVNTFQTMGTAYCSSAGGSSTFDWIDYVSLGSINNMSGSDQGYADFTALKTNLAIGTAHTITTSAYVLGDTYDEIFSIWIDYNQDGDFTDTGELIGQFHTNSMGVTYHSFTVPAGAKTGSTIMRVSMKRGTASTSCEIFEKGEVEDYTVTITAPGMMAASLLQQKQVTVLQVSPNPVKDYLYINTGKAGSGWQMQVYNNAGQLLMNRSVNQPLQKIYVGNYPAGLYILRMTATGGITTVAKFIKQ